MPPSGTVSTGWDPAGPPPPGTSRLLPSLWMAHMFGPEAVKQLPDLGEAPAADRSGPECHVNATRASLPGVQCRAGAGVPVSLSRPPQAWSQRRDTCSCTEVFLRTRKCHPQTWAWWLLLGTAGVRIPCQALARERTHPLVVPRKAASRPCCSKGPAPRGREEAPASCFFIFCRGKLTEASAAGPTGEPGSFRPGTGQASADTLSALASDSRVQGVGVCWSLCPLDDLRYPERFISSGPHPPLYHFEWHEGKSSVL